MAYCPSWKWGSKLTQGLSKIQQQRCLSQLRTAATTTAVVFWCLVGFHNPLKKGQVIAC